MMEVVYTWPDGREEVRYRRAEGTPEAADLERQVETLRAKHGEACPYSVRRVAERCVCGNTLDRARFTMCDRCKRPLPGLPPTDTELDVNAVRMKHGQIERMPAVYCPQCHLLKPGFCRCESFEAFADRQMREIAKAFTVPPEMLTEHAGSVQQFMRGWAAAGAFARLTIAELLEEMVPAADLERAETGEAANCSQSLPPSPTTPAAAGLPASTVPTDRALSGHADKSS